MQEHHTRPHFIGKVRYKESTGEKEENIKRVQEKRRKNSNRVQEKRRKTSKEYKPWTNNTGDEERTKQTHIIIFFVKLPR